jgi:hypothetical protein
MFAMHQSFISPPPPPPRLDALGIMYLASSFADVGFLPTAKSGLVRTQTAQFLKLLAQSLKSENACLHLKMLNLWNS